MSFYSIASSKSVWRGYDYYKNNKILYCDKINDTEFVGACSGSNGEEYEIYIDTEHPKRSTCTCPHAEGIRRCCKHKIALFFTAFPDEAKNYYDDLLVEEEEEEEEEWELYEDEEEEKLYEEEMEYRVDSYIESLKKDELKQLVYELLYEGPEWQYDKFIREHIEY